MKVSNNSVSVLFMLFSVLFCVCLITANVLETKQISIGWVNITGGLLVFPVSYIINDCVCEVWGYKKARLLIWLGFLMNFIFVSFGALADEAGFHAVFGLAPRIALASFLAFLVGSFINAYVMSRMKVSSGGKHFALRAVMSTVYGETADSIIFFPLALGGVVPLAELPKLIISQIVLKTVYEIVVLPITMRVVGKTKQIEGVDTYDRNINYGVFKIGNI